MRIRSRILARDPICKSCEAKGRVTVSTEVDHIISLDNGGSNDDANLQGLCHDCHADKTALDRGYRERITIGADGWPESILMPCTRN